MRLGQPTSWYFMSEGEVGKRSSSPTVHHSTSSIPEDDERPIGACGWLGYGLDDVQKIE